MDNYVALLSPEGMTVLNRATRRAPAQPYHVRREYAKPNFQQRPLYHSCRLWVAMIRMGLV